MTLEGASKKVPATQSVFCRVLCVSALLLITVSVSAQYKIEKEIRIKEEEAPKVSVDSLHHAFVELPGLKIRKLKWYRELDADDRGYEAKFKWSDHRYSVEFDSLGVFEDIEVEVEMDELSDAHRSALCGAFEKIPSFQLDRMQAQWRGYLAEYNTAESIALYPQPKVLLYEIEFYGKIDGENARWEGHFSPEGELLEYWKMKWYRESRMEWR